AELPQILTLLAAAYQETKQTTAYTSSLEKLALLLPSNSLWRSKYQNSPRQIAAMESLALKASMLAALWHYDKGMHGGSSRFFLAAASFYKILADFKPEHPQANEWRLRLGHCYYFAGSY